MQDLDGRKSGANRRTRGRSWMARPMMPPISLAFSAAGVRAVVAGGGGGVRPTISVAKSSNRGLGGRTIEDRTVWTWSGRPPQADSAASQPGSNVCMAPTTIGTPVSADTAAMAAASSPFMAKGFSHRTAFLPARQAAITWTAWNWCGLQMATISTAGIGQQLVHAGTEACPDPAATASATAGSTSMMWRTSRMSRSLARDGRWIACVTGPAPRIPTLAAPVPHVLGSTSSIPLRSTCIVRSAAGCLAGDPAHSQS